MKLLIHELEKHITKFNLLLLVAFLFINFFAVFFSVGEPRAYFHKDDIRAAQENLLTEYKENPAAYEAEYNDYLERLSAYRHAEVGTPFENLKIDVSGYDDRDLFTDVHDIIARREGYGKTVGRVVKSAYDRIRETGILRGKYIYEYQVALLMHYEPLKELEIPTEPIFGWREYFDLNTPVIFLMLSCLVICSNVFLVEKRTRSVSLLSVQKRGGEPLVLSKLAAAVIFSVILTVLFALTSLFAVGISVGLSSPNAVLQSVGGFEVCPYNITILDYFWISIGIRSAVMVVFALFVALLGQWMAGELGVFVLSIAAVFGSYALSFIPPTSSMFILRQFNFFDLAFVNIMFERYRAVNFVFYIGYLPFVMLLLAVSIIVLCAISLAIKLKHNGFSPVTIPRREHKIDRADRVDKDKHGKKQEFSMKMPQSLLTCEFCKHIVNSLGIAVLTLAIVIKIILSSLYFTPDVTKGREILMSYMTDLSGELGEAQEEYLGTERMYVDQSVAEYGEALREYRAGEIDFEEFHKYERRKTYADSALPYLRQAESRYIYLTEAAKSYDRVEFVYDEGAVKYLTQPLDVVMLLLMLFFLCDVFTKEYSSGFIAILSLQKKGGTPVMRTKYLYGFITATVIFVIFSVIDGVCLAVNYDMQYLDIGIMSLPDLAPTELNVSIAVYFLLYKAEAYIGVLIVTMLLLSLSVLSKRLLVSMTLSAGILFVPLAMSALGTALPTWIDQIRLLRPTFIGEFFPVSVVLFTVSTLIFIVSERKWIKRYNKFRKIFGIK